MILSFLTPVNAPDQPLPAQACELALGIGFSEVILEQILSKIWMFP